MRGDNGAAVWWLAPHRPAGPGGRRRGLRRDGSSGGGKRGTQKRRGRRVEERGGRWDRLNGRGRKERRIRSRRGWGVDGPRVRKRTSDP